MKNLLIFKYVGIRNHVKKYMRILEQYRFLNYLSTATYGIDLSYY